MFLPAYSSLENENFDRSEFLEEGHLHFCVHCSSLSLCLWPPPPAQTLTPPPQLYHRSLSPLLSTSAPPPPIPPPPRSPLPPYPLLSHPLISTPPPITRLLASTFLLLKCCFTSTETVGLLGTGAQDVHLDFHTPPELCLPPNFLMTYQTRVRSYQQDAFLFGTSSVQHKSFAVFVRRALANSLSACGKTWRGVRAKQFLL